MAYTPSTLNIVSWNSPLAIQPTDVISGLDDAVNAIISTNGGSLKNYLNAELAKIPVYLSSELSLVHEEVYPSLLHINDTLNPHLVTKLQVGLGNCDNTSDLLKPISTATQDALDLKSDTSTSVQKYSNTSAAEMPFGTTVQRPSTLSIGLMRFNTDIAKIEVFNGALWECIGIGATGGGTDTVFVETSYAVTQNYTITTGKSAITVGNSNGNVTVSNDVTITIPDGSQWNIVGA